jgi:hypothetical protein
LARLAVRAGTYPGLVTLRIAGFLDDLAEQERMRAVDAGVEDRERAAAAVETHLVRDIGLNQRHALREARL